MNRSRLVGCIVTVGLCLWGLPSRPRLQEVERLTLIHAGALLAVPGEAPLANASLVIRRGHIVEVRSGLVDPAELGADARVEIIDLRHAFVLPGLIDGHTHMTWEAGTDALARRDGWSEADYALRSTVFARRALFAGFTTVRDLGSAGEVALALRDAIRDGIVPGPRMLVAGQGISATGGHGDATLGRAEHPFSPPGPSEGICDGPLECRKAVRVQVRRGVDVVKLVATGGVLSDTAAGTEQQLFDDELEAIVDTGHQLGRKVAAHAHGTRGINAALRAGADSIEHGTYLDDESIRLFRKSGAFLVPTLLAGRTVEERARVGGLYPPAVARKALEVGPVIRRALAQAHEAGVRIAFGTDSGVSRHGENAREFAYMVESGMSEMEVIVAATRNGAELLGLESEIGTLEPGRSADVIATAGNPLVDVTELQRVVFVMRAGVVYSR